MKTLIEHKKLLIIILTFLCLSVFIFSSLAKYKIELGKSYSVESSKFYFKSDITTEKTEIIKSWDVEDVLDINFSVKNYENTLLYTKSDIKYEISIDKITDENDEIETKLYNENNEIIKDDILKGNKISENNYTLKISKKKENINSKEFKIKLNISALSPYIKKMSRNINIKIINKEPVITIEDENDYVKMNIQANETNEQKKILYKKDKLSIGSQYEINNKESDAYNSFNLSISKNNNYSIIFIKKDSSNNIELGEDIILK